MNNNFNIYANAMKAALPLGESFDVIERHIIIGGRAVCLYYIDGFVKDDVMQRIMSDFFKITEKEMKLLDTAKAFTDQQIPYVEVKSEIDVRNMIKDVLSGQTVMLVDGYEEAIVIDLRTYPVRGIEEPEKEKTLRGSRDGLVETIVFNTALVRRRIRDERLVFDMHSVGKISKTDVCIGYMKGLADEELVKKFAKQIDSIQVDTLTVGDQSLVEVLGKSGWLNPFPKVRYTERPDVVAAHLTEGKFVIMVDNSPSAMILPTYLLDFTQDVDDYYFPVLTGNYFRFVRNINMLAILFLTPVYLILAGGGGLFGSGAIPLPDGLEFLLPQEPYNIPIFWQFLLLEIAVDGLKLASLNTPNSLGMSLSVIGALILGEFSVTAGWFIPQTILCMAVVALASFTQPSIELGYAVKFMRIGMLAGIALFGIWGFLGMLVLELILLASTKTLAGKPYLYPFIPFNWKKLKELLFRTRKTGQ